jgi:hypothetical protein
LTEAEPAEGLRTLLESSPPAPPVEVLRGRVDVRRRRRRTVWTALAGMAAVAVAVPMVNRPADEPVRVIAGPDTTVPATVPGVALTVPAADPTSTTIPIEFVAGRPISYRIDFTAPPGWQTLFAAADHMVVATRPLSDSDRALALLARNDSSFSAFPADGVVVVVGNDPLEAKGTMAPDGTLILPGPAYGLGPEKFLAGGVRVRRGDVPQSSVKIASYAGPRAPANRLQEAETIASGLRLIRTGDPSVRPEPPPPGSRPGLPAGTLPVAEAGLPEVARTAASGSTLVLVAGQNCAYLRWADAQTSLPGYQPLAGGCGTRPSGTFIETFGQPVIVTRGPDTQPSTVVIFRTGPNLARFSARLADGRTVAASIGLDGWGLVAGDGRIVAVSGIDTQGRPVPETLVG